MHVSQVEGVRFFWASFVYTSANAAKVVWERADKKLGDRDLDLGLYRHGDTPNPGMYVTAVSILPEGIQMFEDLAKPGKEIVLDDEIVLALLMRRMRQFVEHSGKGETHASYRHGEGIRLGRDGTAEPLE